LILSPQGKHLGTIELPEIPANCAWGDAEEKTLYITARTSLFRVNLAAAGKQP
jgi:gluconolactonase